MKQRTSVYLDDLDREAMRQVADYYGITSDTDVLCFSVRAVARAVPQPQKAGQVMTIPVQDGHVPQKQWQVDVYTTKDQKIPHTFYDATLAALRDQVHTWLISKQPTYIDAGYSTYQKEDRGMWRPLYTKNNEEVYKEVYLRHLRIFPGPGYEERGMVDGKFHLEYIRTTEHHDHVVEVNKMLERGWRILSTAQYPDGNAYFILGHTEANAF